MCISYHNRNPTGQLMFMTLEQSHRNYDSVDILTCFLTIALGAVASFGFSSIDLSKEALFIAISFSISLVLDDVILIVAAAAAANAGMVASTSFPSLSLLSMLVGAEATLSSLSSVAFLTRFLLAANGLSFPFGSSSSFSAVTAVSLFPSCCH